MITFEIQLISKPEMSVQEATDYIASNFPQGQGCELAIRNNPKEGTVQLDINQERLTDAQRDWLHMPVFAARYIDSFRVVPQEEFWTLKAAAELAERTFDNLANVELDDSGADALWFQTVVLARTGEQIERVANALERIVHRMEHS